MKEMLAKLTFGLFEKTNISLAMLIGIIFFLTPVFTGTMEFIQKVHANSRRIDEHEQKFREYGMLNEKMNMLLIEFGVSKYKIELLEKQYKNKGE